MPSASKGRGGEPHSFSNARLALQSQNFSSHCCDRYASRTPAASGLYRSSPLMMLRISAGLSEGSSPFAPFMVGDVSGDGGGRGVGGGKGLAWRFGSALRLAKIPTWWGWWFSHLFFRRLCVGPTQPGNGLAQMWYVAGFGGSPACQLLPCQGRGCDATHACLHKRHRPPPETRMATDDTRWGGLDTIQLMDP
jgi:hypothetical protein